MDQGYPAEADIDTFLSNKAIELLTENNANFIGEFKQFVYGIINAAGPALALSVYAASATTFNIRGGRYIYNAALKTYTPGSAIDPTDNDTTYVWMKPDNTVSYDIDGTGWPVTEHVKLAEVVVDAAGTITAINDMRAVEFYRNP